MVANDGQGVSIHVCGDPDRIMLFAQALRAEAPALARVDSIEWLPAGMLPIDAGFSIAASLPGRIGTGVVPDAASCAACVAEVFDPAARRYRYPFTNCTDCGPRLSIVHGIPYDRAGTTMRAFRLCAACRSEYDNPADRRFHAQPIACPECGPRAWLVDSDGAAVAPGSPDVHDALEAACALLHRGAIVAIKGLGGFQFACDATDPAAVDSLRRRKRREHKPFALMARDMDLIRRYCIVNEEEQALLCGPAAPIVLLARRPDAPTNAAPLAEGVAPGLQTLGFMLPNTPLHHLLLQAMEQPIVLTSGNLSGEPQQIDNRQAQRHLGAIADYFLLHDRDVARRVDDSVLRVVAGQARVLRRARGLAPAALVLPPGFEAAPGILALGGELKNSFCLLRDGAAVVSHHIGDLQDAPTHADFQLAVHDYRRLFNHTPAVLAVDCHPEYLSGKLARAWLDASGDGGGVELVQVQHHHAHIASCMADNGLALDTPAVIGVALDGLGRGENGELWGDEFFAAGYAYYQRLARLRPVALPGGAQAMREPWRNTYAHLVECIGWPRLAQHYGSLDLVRRLDAKPRALLDGMLRGQVNSPLASSCGRLFDAVAAACGVCFERCHYEGQAAIEFEAMADPHTLEREDDASAYRFAIGRAPGDALPSIDPSPMWWALLDDLSRSTAIAAISARFHKGLAIAIAQMVSRLSDEPGTATGLRTVVLSGGVFQNRVLLEQVTQRLTGAGFSVLSHRQLPSNDGGLSLGQAVVAAARALAQRRGRDNGV